MLYECLDIKKLYLDIKEYLKDVINILRIILL